MTLRLYRAPRDSQNRPNESTLGTAAPSQLFRNGAVHLDSTRCKRQATVITGIVGRVLPRLALALGFFTMTVIGLTTRLDDRSTQQGTIVVVSKAGMFYSLDRLEVSNWRTRSIRARSNLAGERVWSPDGRELAFTSYWTHLDGNDEIYVASGETGAVINLSQHSGPDSSPVWSPDSTR